MNDNNDKLIILTKTFPFSSGEEFLEEELMILCNRFKSVLIISTAVPYRAKQTRSVPSNVDVIVLRETSNKYVRYCKYLFKGLFGITNSDLKGDITGKKILSRLMSIYTYGRCKSICNKIIKNTRFSKLLNDNNCNVLYSYWFYDLPYISVLLRRHFINYKFVLVSRAHGYDLYDYRNICGYIPFRSIVMSEINKVFTCSKNGKAYLIKKYSKFKNKIDVSYLGTKDCGMNSNYKNSCFHIVTCSAIIPLKRLLLLAKALEIVEKQGFNFKWTCIGDGPLLKELKEYTNTHITNNNVIFMGHLLHDEVLKQLKALTIDLFINVSETEGLPVSIMEAISFGVPVLATDVGGTSEIVIPSLTGELVSKNITPKELAEEIIRCMSICFDRECIRLFWKTNFESKNNYNNFANQISDLTK